MLTSALIIFSANPAKRIYKSRLSEKKEREKELIGKILFPEVFFLKMHLYIGAHAVKRRVDEEEPKAYERRRRRIRRNWHPGIIMKGS